MRSDSKIVPPMINLRNKDQNCKQTPAANHAFVMLKDAFTTVPFMTHFDPKVRWIVKIDALDFVPATVLSQKMHEGILHQLDLYVHKMTAAKCNNEIYDKEPLDVVRSFQEWRKNLEQGLKPVIVYCEYKNLEYFMPTKLLNRCQARWAWTLAQFEFVITYRPGPHN